MLYSATHHFISPHVGANLYKIFSCVWVGNVFKSQPNSFHQSLQRVHLDHLSGVNDCFLVGGGFFLLFLFVFTYVSFLSCFLSLPFLPLDHSQTFFVFFFPFFASPNRISLEIMTLQPKSEDVETAEGVALTVTGVAQVNLSYFS